MELKRQDLVIGTSMKCSRDSRKEVRNLSAITGRRSFPAWKCNEGSRFPSAFPGRRKLLVNNYKIVNVIMLQVQVIHEPPAAL